MEFNNFNNFNNINDLYNVNNAKNIIKKVKGKIIGALVIIALLVAAVISAGIYLDIIQLNEIGKKLPNIYFKNLQYQVIFSALAFVVIFLAISITNLFVKRVLERFLKNNGTKEIKLPNFSIAAVIALIGAFFSKDFFYQKALAFLNSQTFNIKDPLFSKDVGYYVFQRPFLMSIYDFISFLWIFVIVYTIGYYLLTLLLVYKNITLEDLKFKGIIRHNLINVALFFIIKTASYKFEKEGLLFGSFANVKGVGYVQGAGYIDNNIWKLYFTAAPFFLILIVLATFIFIWRGKLKKAAISIAIFPVTWIVISIIAAVTQMAFVKPDEIKAEKQYLKNNMAMTRKAYKIDDIESYPFNIQPLTPATIANNKDTVDNIRVVDYKATLDGDKQLQGLTNFYSFNDGDIINYNINGKETPVFITAREINKDLLQSKTYTNTMFKYTHGYGVVMNPINKLTKQGQADFIISGLTKNENKDLKITEPRIYYGEMTKDYVIVNPASEGALKETDYDGKSEVSYDTENGGGIKLGFLNKLLFALKYSDYNILVSNNVTSKAKILLNRQVVERAQRAVPFLSVDSDPYILLTDDGKLKWILDGYTSTENFPYSQDFGGFNYIRNSVKIIVDAYTGATEYYIIDKNDPIIRAYSKIYPDIFKDGDLPDYLKKHMRYPESLFKLQTEVLKKYHISPDSDQNITNFYGSQDLWKIASIPEKNSEETVLDPYYNMIKLPGKFGKQEELILMRPFTPSGDRHNLGSWLSVRNSMENYGQLIQFNFSNDTQNIFGPYQVEVKINQIDSISKEMTLWGQSGSEVFKGNLLVIPIENSILYVEPVYIKSNGNAIPEVRRIIVGYQDGNDFKYGIGTDLQSTLNNMFGSYQNPPDTSVPTDDNTDINTNTNTDQNPNGETKQQIIDKILSKYDSLKQQMDDLDKLLKELKK
ncbi:MAG: UPF0182 family protein [Bacillota bacterium]|nr:UPF0182 family protein [Bacillota bacterium]